MDNKVPLDFNDWTEWYLPADLTTEWHLPSDLTDPLFVIEPSEEEPEAMKKDDLPADLQNDSPVKISKTPFIETVIEPSKPVTVPPFQNDSPVKISKTPPLQQLPCSPDSKSERKKKYKNRVKNSSDRYASEKKKKRRSKEKKQKSRSPKRRSKEKKQNSRSPKRRSKEKKQKSRSPVKQKSQDPLSIPNKHSEKQAPVPNKPDPVPNKPDPVQPSETSERLPSVVFTPPRRSPPRPFLTPRKKKHPFIHHKSTCRARRRLNFEKLSLEAIGKDWHEADTLELHPDPEDIRYIYECCLEEPKKYSSIPVLLEMIPRWHNKKNLSE